MGDQQQDNQGKLTRLVIWLKAIGGFFVGTATALTKAAICLGALAVYVQFPERNFPAWALVTIVIGVYSIDLAKNIRVKTSVVEVDFNGEAATTQLKPADKPADKPAQE